MNKTSRFLIATFAVASLYGCDLPDKNLGEDSCPAPVVIVP